MAGRLAAVNAFEIGSYSFDVGEGTTIVEPPAAAWPRRSRKEYVLHGLRSFCCPKCGAQPGAPCVTGRERAPRAQFHDERREAAGRVHFVAASRISDTKP